jgi:hypothetical protein
MAIFRSSCPKYNDPYSLPINLSILSRQKFPNIPALLGVKKSIIVMFWRGGHDIDLTVEDEDNTVETRSTVISNRERSLA